MDSSELPPKADRKSNAEIDMMSIEPTDVKMMTSRHVISCGRVAHGSHESTRAGSKLRAIMVTEKAFTKLDVRPFNMPWKRG